MNNGGIRLDGTRSTASRLVSLAHMDDPFVIPLSQLRPLQLNAVNERFQQRISDIALLRQKAQAAGLKKVDHINDIAPLLFAHTAYKSYREDWLTNGDWTRLAGWLDTVSTHRVVRAKGPHADSLDDWLQQLEEEQGHYISCSSGTTGKCSFINSTSGDLLFAGCCLQQGHRWAGLAPARDSRLFSFGQGVASPRSSAGGMQMEEAFNAPGVRSFIPTAPPITIGDITQAIRQRRRIAEGSATPTEIAAHDAQATLRARILESALEEGTDALIESRRMPLHLTGLFSTLHRVAQMVHARGYGGTDFRANTAFVSGGLKREQLPPGYREFICETLNIDPPRMCQAYGMQELNTIFIQCTHGKYHVPPWVVLVILDKSGLHPIEPDEEGDTDGRAGFFDLSLEGHWGGVITGDKVTVSWRTCSCGRHGPVIGADIQRYADLPEGNDQITCAGTMGAYVRGLS